MLLLLLEVLAKTTRTTIVQKFLRHCKGVQPVGYSHMSCSNTYTAVGLYTGSLEVVTCESAEPTGNCNS